MLPPAFHFFYFSLFLIYHTVRLATWREGDEHKPTPKPNPKRDILVVVPVYNEKEETLVEVFDSLRRAKNFYERNQHGRITICVVDDGSRNDTVKRLKGHYSDFDFIFQENKGKREAQAAAFRKHLAHVDYVVNIDSDSVIATEDAFATVKAVFEKEKDVGAITGFVRVKNTDKWLPKILSIRYDLAFLGERYAESSYGYLDCVSGPFSAYRACILKRVLPAYLNQTFLGKKQTYGDDRHLTNLVLKEGWKVKFVPWIQVLTDAPEDLATFFRQQTRWKKSFIRETIYLWQNLLGRIKEKKFWLVQALKLLITLLALTLRVGLVLAAVFISPIYLLHYAVMVFLMSFSKVGYLAAIYDHWWEKIPLNTAYAFLHELFVIPANFVAALGLLDTQWGTR